MCRYSSFPSACSRLRTVGKSGSSSSALWYRVIPVWYSVTQVMLYCRYCVSVFIIPFSVLATTYCSICREIWRHAGRSPQQQGGNCSPLISRAKMNTVKQMVAVLFLYVACSAPFISAQLWATWDELAHTRAFFSGNLHSSNLSIILIKLYKCPV